MGDWTTLEEIEARAKRIEQLAQAARLECVNAKRVVASMRRGGGHNAKKIAEAIRAVLSGITLNGSLAPTTGTIAKTLADETAELTNKTLMEVSPVWDERIDSITIAVNAGGLGKASITANCTSYPSYEPFEGFLTGYKVKLAGCSVADWNDVEYTIHALEVGNKSFLLTTTLSGTDKTETGITVYRGA